MTMEGLIREVIVQGNAAVGALIDVAAIPAEGKRGEPPPVQKEKGLLPALDVLIQGLFEGARKNRGFLSAALFLAHVDDPNFRKRAVIDPPREGKVMKFPLQGVVERFHRRGGRSEDHHRLLHLSPD
jgi:hypothetical protein